MLVYINLGLASNHPTFRINFVLGFVERLVYFYIKCWALKVSRHVTCGYDVIIEMCH